MSAIAGETEEVKPSVATSPTETVEVKVGSMESEASTPPSAMPVFLPGELDLPRRILLGGFTALLVARPLVRGEDPGLMSGSLTDAAGLILTLGWFVLFAGWAAWRMACRNLVWFPTLVEVGLAVAAACAFLSSALAASYQHPAWLISWEWLAYLIAFCLARTLVRTPADNHRLLAVVAASAVCLAAQGFWQYADDVPQLQREFDPNHPERLVQALARQGIFVSPDDPAQLHAWYERIRAGYISAAFSHPNTFAGYLALLFPLVVGWAWAARRGLPHRWKSWLTLTLAVLVAGTLLLTRSRGAILGTLLVGAALLALRSPSPAIRRRDSMLLGGVIVAVASALAFLPDHFAEKARESFAKRLDYWSGSWRIIQDHPWLGVGPGGFASHYLAARPPDAYEDVKDPHNFVLETWSSHGLFALLGVLLAIAAFFRLAWPVAGKPWGATTEEAVGAKSERSNEAPSDEHDERPQWEFYVGGMIGLTLAFVLWAIDINPREKDAGDQILAGGALAGVRSLIWFACFALYESLPWSSSAKVQALTAGVAACLLNLCISGGIGFPSLAVVLWVAAALALNELPTRRWSCRQMPAYVLPVGASAFLLLAFLLVTFTPVLEGQSALKQARRYYRSFQEHYQAAKADPNLEEQHRRLGHCNVLIEKHILKGLLAATKADPGRAEAWIELAQWQAQHWVVRNERDGGRIHGQDLINVRASAEANAKKAIELNPVSLDGYLCLVRMYEQFGSLSPTRRKDFAAEIARQLENVIERDPWTPRWRYLHAQALDRADRRADCRAAARNALELDARTAYLPRRLSDEERRQLHAWINETGGKDAKGD